MQRLKQAIYLIASVAPGVAFAQGPTLGILIDRVLGILNGIIPIIIALAVIYFMWGVAQYIKGAGDAKQEGRQIMIWGVIAIFVMTSVYGLVNVLARTLDLNTAQPNVPQLRIGGASGGSSSGSFSSTPTQSITSSNTFLSGIGRINESGVGQFFGGLFGR